MIPHPVSLPLHTFPDLYGTGMTPAKSAPGDKSSWLASHHSLYQVRMRSRRAFLDACPPAQSSPAQPLERKELPLMCRVGVLR